MEDIFDFETSNIDEEVIKELDQENHANCDILLKNKKFLIKNLKLKDKDYMSNFDYLHYLHDWNYFQKKGVENQKQLYTLLSNSSQFLSSIKDDSALDIRSVVYFITYQQKVLYIGSTTTSYNLRYQSGKRTRLTGAYEELFNISDKDEEIFVKPLKSSQIRKIESRYINAVTAFGIPTCNIKCEGETFLELMDLYRKTYPRKSLADFLNIVWNIDLRKVRAKLAA